MWMGYEFDPICEQSRSRTFDFLAQVFKIHFLFFLGGAMDQVLKYNQVVDQLKAVFAMRILDETRTNEAREIANQVARLELCLSIAILIMTCILAITYCI